MFSFSRPRCAPRISPACRSRPAVEVLEDRACPSATVVFDDPSNTLFVMGTAGADNVKIVHDDAANQLRVEHDGVTDSFISSGVDRIVVRLGKGQDSFTQTVPEGQDFFRAKTLDVRTGAGRDKVMFDLAGNSNHWATLKEDLTIDLRTGGARDVVQINLPYVEIANKLQFDARLGAGNDRFDAIAFGGVGITGLLELAAYGDAGNDLLRYFGTYDSLNTQSGIDVGDQATMLVLFNGGAGADRLRATYVGEVDGTCSFLMDGDNLTGGSADRDIVFAELSTFTGSTGAFTGRVRGVRGDDVLRLLADIDGSVTSDLMADGGAGFDECVSTFNVIVKKCEA